MEVDPLFKRLCDDLVQEAAARGEKRSAIEITRSLRDILKGMPLKEAMGNGNGNGKGKKKADEYYFPHM